MTINAFTKIPDAARAIRRRVFIEEQGFCEEFDDIDLIAVHFVAYDECGTAIATCRIFPAADGNGFILGRLAVSRECRKSGVGRAIVTAAEAYVREVGGRVLSLHAQSRIAGFYARLGYTAYGVEDEDQGVPHIHMKKML